MKLILTLLSAFLFTISMSGQTEPDIFYNEITYFLNENGTSIGQAEFERILKEDPGNYHRWDQIENDSIRIARLIPRKEELNVSYPDIYKAVERFTNTPIEGNPVIIIVYNYLNDICSPASSFNEWGTLRTRRDKRFSDNIRRRIEKEHPNVLAYHFFETGITIDPSQVLKQHFHIDKDNYFRKTLFITPSSCGSIALIKPGGKTIIHNGETSVPVLAGSLAE